jgi:hypothetical protein
MALLAGAAPTGGTPPWVVAAALVLTAVGGAAGLSAPFLVRRQHSKLKADTAQVITGAAVTLVEPLERRLAEAERDGQRTRARLRRVENQLITLTLAIMEPNATVEGLRAIAANAARQREARDR